MCYPHNCSIKPCRLGSDEPETSLSSALMLFAWDNMSKTRCCCLFVSDKHRHVFVLSGRDWIIVISSRNTKKKLYGIRGCPQFVKGLKYFFLIQALQGGWVPRLFVLPNEWLFFNVSFVHWALGCILKTRNMKVKRLKRFQQETWNQVGHYHANKWL